MKTLLEEKNHMRKLMGLSLLKEEENPTGKTQTSLSRSESEIESQRLDELLDEMESTILFMKANKKYKYGNILSRFRNKQKILRKTKKVKKFQKEIDSLEIEIKDYDEGKVVSDSDKKKFKSIILTGLLYIAAQVATLTLIKNKTELLDKVTNIKNSL